MTMEELVEAANIALKEGKLIAQAVYATAEFCPPGEPDVVLVGPTKLVRVELREPTAQEIKDGLRWVMAHE